MPSVDRSQVFPEPELPDATELVAEGRGMAQSVQVGSCPFLTEYYVRSESEYKRRRMDEGPLMFHAQFGFRSPEKSRRAYAEIHDRLAAAGYRVDRYGICLDWSMGYPATRRADMPRGTGLILQEPEDFALLTQGAPVAPHFGDFVIGTPASVENTAAALAAGSTSIGNLGQYFTFRMPRWSDDVGITAETVKALALCAAQSVEVLIHSNLDDGFAALFCDQACGIGAVLIERTIVDELIGGRVSHCYGHVFSDPLNRLAFQRALARVSDTPGSMVYGNTTIFVENEVENYANLASYLLVDVLAQRALPSGHALNPVPVTEALRIPEVDEIVNAHLFANRLASRSDQYESMFDLEAADRIADRLVEGGHRFKERVLTGLTEAGIDVTNPVELLLAIRRIGAKQLEELWGPGTATQGALRNRMPLVKATTVASVEAQGERVVAALEDDERQAIRAAGFTACVTSTDVHEYGKVLVATVLRQVDVEVAETEVSTDPELVVERAMECGADFIAISTYSGVALDYVQKLSEEMSNAGLDVPVFIGGKLNRVPEDSETSMPIDVTYDLTALGAIVCHSVEDMVRRLVDMAGKRNRG
jgi:methylmalonyl-CoA mutase cobalamin-binding domain/chain